MVVTLSLSKRTKTDLKRAVKGSNREAVNAVQIGEIFELSLGTLNTTCKILLQLYE